MVQAFNLSTWEAKAKGVPGQQGLHRESLSQTKRKGKEGGRKVRERVGTKEGRKCLTGLCSAWSYGGSFSIEVPSSLMTQLVSS